MAAFVRAVQAFLSDFERAGGRWKVHSVFIRMVVGGTLNLAHLKAHVIHVPLDLNALAQAQEAPVMVVTTHFGKRGISSTGHYGQTLCWRLPRCHCDPGQGQVQGRVDADGGYSDPLPLEKAIELGGERMLVVRTRPMGDHATQVTSTLSDPIGTETTRPSLLCLTKDTRAMTQWTSCSLEETTKDGLGKKLRRLFRCRRTLGAWARKKLPPIIVWAWRRP